MSFREVLHRQLQALQRSQSHLTLAYRLLGGEWVMVADRSSPIL